MTHVQLLEILDQRLVLASTDAEFAVRAKHRLRRLGWEVYPVKSAASARRLIRECSPPVVVLDTDLGDESGWLLCKKLTLEQPDLRVILVSKRRYSDLVRFADFVGAAGLVFRQDGIAGLMSVIGEQESVISNQ
jgi:ActR/RegA family two-component response regulator